MLESMTSQLFKPPELTEDDLNEVIQALFAVDHPSVLFVDQVMAQPRPSIKSAPPLTLLASLCMYLLKVEGLASVSALWVEFVKELRWHWDHFELLPRTPFASPGLGYSKLYQRMQMLNWCIAQRRERNERAKTGSVAVAKKAALGGWSDTEGAEFESVSSSDDETTSGKKQETQTPSLPAAQPGWEGREGVREQLSLKLLRTGAPMCAPFTQDGQTFVTEDSIAEQQTLLLSLGSGKAGSEMRAQMQVIIFCLPLRFRVCLLTVVRCSHSRCFRTWRPSAPPTPSACCRTLCVGTLRRTG
jgi:hypothetical protein